MAAYIVGLIVGAICLISPIAYWMNADRCVVSIMGRSPNAAAHFTPYCSQQLLLGVTVLGAVVLLLSAAMVAFTGLRRLRNAGPLGSNSMASPPQKGAGPTSSEL